MLQKLKETFVTMFSGVATPVRAHVKLAGARVKIMQKAKVKDRLCAIASFMRT